MSLYIGNEKVAPAIVSGGTTPTGTLSITANGIYDVTNYASANVSVAGGASQSFRFYGTEELEIYQSDWASDVNAFLTLLSQCTPVMIYGSDDNLFAWKDANGNDFEYDYGGYAITMYDNGEGTWYYDGKFGTYYNIEITPTSSSSPELANPLLASVDIIVEPLTT